MTVSIDPSSINMTVRAAGVKPVISTINTPLVYGGNTFAGGSLRCQLSHIKEKLKLLDAFSIDSRVKFTVGPGDLLDDWKVGFVQVVRRNTQKAVYLGRIQSEGQIICDAVSKMPVLLDCVAPPPPWYETPDEKSAFKGPVAMPRSGDGPDIDVPLTLGNEEASSDNFLFSFTQDSDFWTVLTAVDSTKPLQYLAHIHWRVLHSVGVIWRGGAPLAGNGGSSVNFDQFVLGQPSDPAVQKILSAPTGPLANDVYPAVFRNSLLGGPAKDPTIHQTFAEWRFGLVAPSLFWQ